MLDAENLFRLRDMKIGISLSPSVKRYLRRKLLGEIQKNYDIMLIGRAREAITKPPGIVNLAGPLAFRRP
jgi:hypothetical protein